MKKSKVQGRLIHIHAKCAAFEFFEYADEKKAVDRLTDILDGFNELRSEDKGELSVRTSVVNPELNFNRR